MSPDSTHEVSLHGSVANAVVRIGDTVRRRAGAWTSSVDALLEHLHHVGFDGAPRPMGRDELDRQVLTFAEGHVDADPSDLDPRRLFEVGALIRRFHDAASSFVSPPDAGWNVAIPPDREELICHHDLAPWNLVRSQSTLTIIDWDGAGPGSRLWDLAYAAHGFVPLSPGGARGERVAGERLAALVDGYGLDQSQRLELLELLEPRIRSMYELLRDGHETSTPPWSQRWDEGHGQVWLADAEYVKERSHVWAAALGLSA